MNQMFAQKPHLKLVRGQHFADEKVISAVVAKVYRAACQFSSLTNDDLVGIQQASADVVLFQRLRTI